MNENVIKKVKLHDLGSLCDELTTRFKEARRVLARNCFSKSQATELAKYLEVIRMLLQDLEQATHSLTNAEDEASEISELRDNYYELEGIVKELRNDLSGTCCNK
jgi:hypothetical protein